MRHDLKQAMDPVCFTWMWAATFTSFPEPYLAQLCICLITPRLAPPIQKAQQQMLVGNS
jgi:hypothetical protein